MNIVVSKKKIYVVRLASKTTDVNWVKAKDPSAPVNYYADK
jgi:hypothetical protein